MEVDLKNTNVTATMTNASVDMFSEPTYTNKEFAFYTNGGEFGDSCCILNVGK